MMLAIVTTLISIIYGIARAVVDTLDPPASLTLERFRQILRIRSFHHETNGLINATRCGR